VYIANQLKTSKSPSELQIFFINDILEIGIDKQGIMSASPTNNAVPSTKRPLDDESSPSGPTDQPDAKRPALDKIVKEDQPKDAGTYNGSAQTPPIPILAEDGGQEDISKALANGHSDDLGDTVVPDAPNGTNPSASSVLNTQPIQSTQGQHDSSTSHSQMHHQGHQDETGWIHVRAVISSAEAATVIGKGGENVSQIRRLSGAKCTVSEYARGAVERILTVSGLVDATAKVSISSYSFQKLLMALGIWAHHPNAKQRTLGITVDTSVKNIPFEITCAPYPYRVDNW
jgi:hypothetical protein